MEPLSALSSTSPSARPAPVLAPDLARVLRDGRALSGAVLQSFGGGGVLIGIGRERVPADAAADAKPGDRLWFALRTAGHGALARGDAGADAGAARALHALVGEVAPRAQTLSALVSALAAQAAAGHPSSALAERLRREIAAHAFRAGDGASALAELVRSDGVTYEARLAASARDDLQAEAAIRRDLKALLLAALTALPEGEARTAAEAALRSVEAEQLAHLVRRAAGEGAQHAIVVQDAARSATAYLTIDVERERGGGSRPAGDTRRVSIALDLDRLGPVRAEVASIGSSIAVRVEAGGEGAVDLLRGRVDELRERLALHASEVHVAVAARAPCTHADAAADSQTASAHVVDLSG